MTAPLKTWQIHARVIQRFVSDESVANGVLEWFRKQVPMWVFQLEEVRE